jgi:hypothetical protein
MKPLKKGRAFAQGTTVSSGKSKMEVDALLEKHGATQRGVMENNGTASILFALAGRCYRIDVPLPANSTDQLTRERWRAVVLMVKAKLELVRIGASTIEREFLADLIMADGNKLADHIRARLAIGAERLLPVRSVSHP